MITKTTIQCHRCGRYAHHELEQEKYDHDAAMKTAIFLARDNGWVGEIATEEIKSTMLCYVCVARSEFADHEEPL